MPTPSITTKLYASETYRKDQPAWVTFEITNHSEKAVHILKWNTPLEGLKSDCLKVTKNGKPVPYDGRLVKRSPPKPKDFIKLEPGQSVSKKIDLSESYDLSGATNIKVKFKTENLVFQTPKPKSNILFSAFMESAPAKPLAIQSRAATFTLQGSGTTRPTIAEQIRREEASEGATEIAPQPNTFALLTLAIPLTFKPCKFKGGSGRRQATVRNAHKNGYEMTIKTIGKIEANNKYETWFGNFKKSHLTKIKSDFTKMKNDFEHQTFTYDLTGDDCDRGDYAFTYPSTKRISLCSSFWMAPATGANSKAGTIVHEHSHHSAGTDDHAYGSADCRRLANYNSNKAVRNADSHEFFVGG